jgi:hypothetical protein
MPNLFHICLLLLLLLLLLGNVLTPWAGNNTHEFREHAVVMLLFQAQFKTKIKKKKKKKEEKSLYNLYHSSLIVFQQSLILF